MYLRAIQWPCLVALSLALWGCGDAQGPAGDTARPVAIQNADHPGAKQYEAQCVSCHGADGLGQEALNAPALTTLDTDYVARQLRHFREGIRGAHPKDSSGATMAAISTGLDDSMIENLASYVDSLPNTLPPTTLSGDVAQGKDYHLNLCSACHGSNGLGNAALEAPALVGLNDWYLVDQYGKFAAGVRGSHPDDRWGMQMVRLAPAITDDDIIESIATYLAGQPATD